jgi:dihydroneopterin aldolase/2-amino-4-hydroxy-6-hydroxymethyldihydropteridine diphosphokinase
MAEPMDDAFIAVGSNIEPERHIPAAFETLKQRVRITDVSTFYQTEPLGGRAQPPFLNGVWRVETAAPPRSLKFDVLRTVEQELGRVRTDDKYAARVIDLDLILYGETVIEEPGLVLPDPDIQRRPFIAVPLLGLAPDLVLPDTGQQLADLVASMATRGLEPVDAFTRDLRRRLRL